MICKLLSIEGGGILAIKFLIGLLKISREYDRRGIDFLDFFNVFTGVSSGAIIASGLALRERILGDLVRRDEKLMDYLLKESGYDLNSFRSLKRMLLDGRMKCSTLIVNFLIYLFKNKSGEIFVLNKNRNRLIEPKYTDDKIKIFKKYINYDLKDVPQGRYLILKTFNLIEMNINLFSNHKGNNGNKYSTNIAEIVHWSSNAPTYFPNNGIHLDGGNFINSAFYSEKKLFENDDIIIFNIGSKVSKLQLPINNQEYQWVSNIVNIFYNVGKQLDIITNDKYHHLGFDFKNYQLDDISEINTFIKLAEEINIESSINFLEKYFNNNNVNNNKKIIKK